MSADRYVARKSFWDDAGRADALGVREKKIRDQFVREYLVDMDPLAAAIRCGYMQAFAKEYALKFMAEPYVQQMIQEGHGQLLSDDGILKQVVKHDLLKAARYYGEGASHSARVSALAHLAKILGMDTAAKAEEQEQAHRGGVMQVPTIANITEWEAAAAAQQAELQTNA
jgi:phage terminase small subunit